MACQGKYDHDLWIHECINVARFANKKQDFEYRSCAFQEVEENRYVYEKEKSSLKGMNTKWLEPQIHPFTFAKLQSAVPLRIQSRQLASSASWRVQRSNLENNSTVTIHAEELNKSVSVQVIKYVFVTWTYSITC